jgi:hypothetical protein
MKVLDKILSGVKAVAPTAANLVIPGSGPLVESLMRAVTGDNPETPIEKVAKKLQASPQLLMEFHTRLLDHEARLAQIDAQKMAVVNATMQAETKSEHWPQYAWRPFNGFTFPLAVLLIYFALPMFQKPVPEVPQWVWMGWLAILGVATWDRGKEKRLKAGDQSSGLLEGAIRAIRNG